MKNFFKLLKRIFVLNPKLRVAVAQKNNAEVQRLLQAGASANCTASLILDLGYVKPILCEAVKNSDLAIIKSLIEHGADVEKRSLTRGMTAIHFCLLFAPNDKVKEIFDYLISNDVGANPKTLTYWNETTLMFLAGNQHLASESSIYITEKLIALNVDINAAFAKSGHETYTALDIASAHGNTIMKDLLIRHGATANLHSDADQSVNSSAGTTSHIMVTLEIEKPRPLTFEERFNKLKNKGNITVPKTHLCPIFHTLMDDPITVSSGYTFDRSSLQSAFASAKNPSTLPCPITRKSISIHELNNGTNITIRDIIEDFLCGLEKAEVEAEKKAPEAKDAPSIAIEDIEKDSPEIEPTATRGLSNAC
jgi:ankyrin repeat protein